MDETIDHVLIQCMGVVKVWQVATSQLSRFLLPTKSFCPRLDRLITNGREGKIFLLVGIWTAWFIWRVKNNSFFRQEE